ncbi:FG-GAP repeat protein [Streptomyces sp. NPDC020490]|uniref:FG-GAP repeat protein n=1 Tax=Streptomyces sp. NPDC020490 TaxID=3365078 RepID=UPI00379DBB16
MPESVVVPQSIAVPTARRATARRAVAIAVALLATSAVTAAVPAAHAQPAPTREARQDFNGDGYADLAVAAPYATVGGKTKAGYVAVLYGSPKGLLAASRKVYTQASPGIPGTPEKNDMFGFRMSAADLDGDGFTDLLVESADERWQQDGIERAASRTILWGSRAGFVSGKVLPAEGTGLNQAPLTVAGDFNGDGHQDLARSGRVMWGPFGRDGVPAAVQEGQTFTDNDEPMKIVVTVAVGDTDGDGADDIVTVARASDGWDDEGTYGNYVYYARGGRDGLGVPVHLTKLDGPKADSVALGDLTGDGRADLVVDGRNAVRVVRAGKQGLADTAPRVITQDTPGVPGVKEFGDGFGEDVSVGDVNGDGYGDILAGVPYESFGGRKNAGAFVVIPGGPTGPTGAGTKAFDQNSADVPGVAETDDHFGAAVHLIDANGDGRTEPVVSAPWEDSRAGAVWVFRATSAGATAKGSFVFGAGTLGTTASGAQLGTAFSD